jgi:hypothetical protein
MDDPRQRALEELTTIEALSRVVRYLRLKPAAEGSANLGTR